MKMSVWTPFCVVLAMSETNSSNCVSQDLILWNSCFSWYKISYLFACLMMLLDSELANVSNWLKLNKLSLNVQKCKYIIFHMPKKYVNALHLVIDGAVIDRTFNSLD